MKYVIAFVVSILLLPFHLMWEGYVGSVLWGWFAVPTLHLPPITWLQAVGLSLVATAIFPRHISDSDGDDKTPEQLIAGVLTRMFLAPAILLLMGWFVK